MARSMIRKPKRGTWSNWLEYGLLVAMAELGLFLIYKAVTKSPAEILNDDISAIHGAIRLVIEGRISLANLYDFETFRSTLGKIGPISEHIFNFPWLYPPNGFLLLSPIGTIPYAWVHHFMIIATILGAFSACFLSGARGIRLLIYTVGPTVGLTVWAGQVDGLVLLLLAIGLNGLHRFPQTSGAFLALSSLKPQLGMLSAIGAIILGRFKAALGLFFGSVPLLVISVFLFGINAWLSFLKGAQEFLEVIYSGFFKWSLLTSPYSFARAIGFEHTGAYFIQIGLSGFLIFAIIWTWLQQISFSHKVWVLVISILLFSPYQRGYGLIILLIPLSMEHREKKPIKWERLAILFTLTVNPVMGLEGLHLPISFVAPLLFIILCSFLYRAYK